MATVFIKFLQPYVLMLLGMTYSLQQVLEGLGINKTRFEPWKNGSGAIVGSMLDVDSSLVLPMLAVLVFCVVWFFLILIALRAIWEGRAMVIGVLLLVIPGFLSIVGAWPEVQWLPYVIGSGYVGNPWGMLLLQVFAMTSGWALTVLLTHWLGLDDRFRHGYDQFWYALAILAGLFFVADLNANRQRDDLRQSVATSRAASSYLLNQVQRLDEACQSGAVKLALACRWARSSQWQLERYAQYGENLFWQLGPEQEWRIYTGSATAQNDNVVDALRQELHQYNLQMCPVTDLGGGATQSSRVSRSCQTSPTDFCTAYPSRKLASVDPIEARLRTVAIANECIVPTLHRLKVEQVALAAVVDDNAKAWYLRTMFFIFVAFVAGGKVANASVPMTEAIRKGRSNKLTGYVVPKPLSRLSQLLARVLNQLREVWASIVRRMAK